jgi:hypothetical protein
MPRTRVCRLALAILVILVAPRIAAAQQGAIAGTVKDATGAVLPGVTVEAASPALIEKVRSAITDASGQYKIIDLPPGIYSVTFTLEGFSSAKREGITLNVGFTASVNTDLKVGGVAETIVVSGANPVVDVQNVRTQAVATREVIDTLPTGKLFNQIGKLIPAVSGDSDVGGSTTIISPQLKSYGGRTNDQVLLVDGMPVTGVQFGAGSTLLTPLSDAMIDQTIFEAAGHSAEWETGGVIVNLVPKAGGNTFNGSVFGNFTTTSLQSNNLTADLRTRGLTASNPVDYTLDASAGIGGPIARDKLWFFSSFRDLESSVFTSDRYPNLLPTNGWTYVANTSSQPTNNTLTRDGNGRLTWQMSPKNKISVLHDYTRRHDPHYAPTVPASLEATWNQGVFTHITQASWSMPATNRLLFDAGFSATNMHFVVQPQADSVGPSALDIGTGVLFRSLMCGPCSSSALTYRDLHSNNEVFRASASYVTGRHAAKVGLTINPGTADFYYYSLADYEVRLLRGVPTAAVFLPTPFETIDKMSKNALFAQDQWTVSRLTLNLGARFDWFTTHYPDVHLAATDLLPVRNYPGAQVLNWQDLSPRLGASYDVFGNGKTAVKASFSRYVVQEATDLTRNVDPAVTSGGTLQRTWNDTNGDFIPQGDPTNPAANGELGPSPNRNWGTPNLTFRYDPSWATGFGVRPDLWEVSAGVQHEVTSGVSANAMYFRRWYGNFMVTDNQAVAASDYSNYCITTPADSRLPGGGGQRICGLYDISPAKLGQINNVGTSADNYGKQTELWRGVDLSLNARLGHGVFLQGGMSTGKTITDDCAIVTTDFNKVAATTSLGTVQSTQMCHLETPFLTQFKMFGSYTLPWGIQASGTFQSVPGAAISANYVATNAQIAPSLGRNLSAGPTGTVTVNVVAPGTMYGDRLNQLDVRFAKIFKLSRTRLKAMVDLYNVMNGNPVLSWNNTYGTNGATWLTPLSILPGRLVKFGAQLDF